MTITTELRGHAHRHRMASVLAMTTRLCRWERFTLDATITARVDVESDCQLRELLLECSDFWEFDTDRMVLTRKYELDGEYVRMEIGVGGLHDDDVYRVLNDTEAAF